MRFYNRMFFVLSFLFIACFCLPACNDASKKEIKGKVVVNEVEYSIRQTHGIQGPKGAEGTKGTWGRSYVIDARGKVKNVGDVDVKKVVVTGYCRSCTLAMAAKQWFISDVDKTANQKDTISYLAVGAEEEFRFEEVAFYFTYEEAKPENLPENIEIVVDFEPVE